MQVLSSRQVLHSWGSQISHRFATAELQENERASISRRLGRLYVLRPLEPGSLH